SDRTGAVYFQEFPGFRIARLDPATNTLTEWSFANDLEFGDNLVFESGRLFFGNVDSNGATAVVSLDPSTTGIDSTLFSIVSDPVTVASVVVTPVVTHQPRRRTRVHGSVTQSVPTQVGPFTVFPSEAQRWVSGDGAGTIYFTANGPLGSIGRLSP